MTTLFFCIFSLQLHLYSTKDISHSCNTLRFSRFQHFFYPLIFFNLFIYITVDIDVYIAFNESKIILQSFSFHGIFIFEFLYLLALFFQGLAYLISFSILFCELFCFYCSSKESKLRNLLFLFSFFQLGLYFWKISHKAINVSRSLHGRWGRAFSWRNFPAHRRPKHWRKGRPIPRASQIHLMGFSFLFSSPILRDTLFYCTNILRYSTPQDRTTSFPINEFSQSLHDERNTRTIQSNA